MKTDYPKIDLFLCIDGISQWGYVASTTWAKTCSEAKANYIKAHPHIKPDQVKASFSK